MIVYGFYKNNELVYIGQTTMRLEKRIQCHYSCAKLKKNTCMLIVRALIKYGIESFSYKVLKECKNLEDLNDSEISLIKEYNPRYNIRLGGVNGKHSKETKLKISNIQKKKILCVNDQICFFSVLDAEAFYNAGKGTIGRVALKKRNSYRGKTFEFINIVS